MVDVSVTTATYTGFLGGPGTIRLHWEPLTTPQALQAAVDAHRVFCTAFAPTMKTTWSIQVQATVQDFDVGTSELVREQVAASTPPPVVGSGLASASFAGGTGVMVSWSTGSIINGRHISGRTYMVPMQNVSDPDGTLLASVISAATNAGTTLIANSDAHLVIWAKVFDRDVDPPVQIGGTIARVISCSVRDKAAVLRSRRD